MRRREEGKKTDRLVGSIWQCKEGRMRDCGGAGNIFTILSTAHLRQGEADVVA